MRLTMHKRNETASFNIVHLFLDTLVIFIGYCVTSLIYHGPINSFVFREHLWVFVIFSVIFAMSMLLTRMYNVTTFYYMDRIIKRTLASVVISGMSLATVIFMAKIDQTSRLFFMLFILISCILVLCNRIAIRLCKAKRIGNGYIHVLFIGDSRTLERYLYFIDKTSIRLKVVKSMDYNDPSLETPEAFSRMLMDISVNEVQFDVSLEKGSKSANMQALLETCENMGITARIILDGFDLPISKRYLSSVGTYPVITYHSVSLDKPQLFVKSVIDVAGAIFGVLILSPIFIITAIAIKLDSPGPVFFKQKRVGINGNVFNIYKFRSMYIDAEARKQELMAQNKIKGGLMFKIDNDPRITKIGKYIRKTSIDELPQLFNVLKREMSMVGTRPPTVDEARKYNPEHWRRISILPGITGMWQVNGRSQILDFEDVVTLDKKYIDEWSLPLDIKLMFQTIKVVFTTQGAC